MGIMNQGVYDNNHHFISIHFQDEQRASELRSISLAVQQSRGPVPRQAEQVRSVQVSPCFRRFNCLSREWGNGRTGIVILSSEF